MNAPLQEQEALLQEDAQSRRRALELESFIVEAPAGAGKTELLTQRFLRLLQTVREPEEIIAITFTNKAAAEMRLRILDSLNLAAAGTPPALPHKQITYELSRIALARSAELGWNLLQHPSRLRIYTIDSLSSHLARQMPLMSRFGAQPRVSEDAILHYEQAAQRTLELLDDEHAGETVRRALRYLDNDGVRLAKLLASMLASRDQWLDYTQPNSPLAAEVALARLVTQDIALAAEVLHARLQSALMPVARYAAGNLPCEHCIALLRDWETEVPGHAETLPLWCAICELLLTASGSFRKRFDKNMGLPPTDEAKPHKQTLEEIIATLQATSGTAEALARLRLLPHGKQNEETWLIVTALAQLLKLAVAQLWLVFQEHGEVDFVEVAQRALLALQDEAGNPTDLALKLDYRIQHLLVDEFQDTSPTQVKLLRCLTYGWTADDGRTLFAVGDPMQSIYRFRKAEVGLFLDVAEHGIAQVRLQRLRLCRNNRSCPPLIAWVNRAFKHVFPQQDSMARGAIRYREFVATRADEAGSGVHIHPLLLADGEDAEAARMREAQQVIDIIRHERAQHPQRKIAVLVRARSHLQTLVAEIRRHHRDLHFQAVEIEALAGRQVVQDLLALTHALQHRADRVHWLAILRAPWCGLKLADLHALAADDRYSTIWSLMNNEARLQTLSDDGRERLLHVRNVLNEAFAQQGRQRVSRWLHGAWLMLGGAQCLWEAGDVRDVQGFFERIEQLDSAGQFSAERLASDIEKLYAAPDVEADGSLQFMTIHKSKGLEFDTVILPGLERSTGNSGQPLLLWEEITSEHENGVRTELVVAPFIPKGGRSNASPTPYDYLKLLEKERSENEDARVLYVAATRAERSLHLLATAKLDRQSGEPKAPANTFLDLLWPALSQQFADCVTEAAVVQENTTASLDIADFVPALVRLDKPAVPAILRERNAQAFAITEFRASDDENESDSNKHIDASIGTLAHRYTEMMAQQGGAAWTQARVASLKPVMQRWLILQGHAEETALAGAERVKQLLCNMLASEDGQWILRPRPQSAAELALTSVDNEAMVDQVVDRTFIEDGVRWVIDYKTAAVDAGMAPAALAQFAERYRAQLERYARLFKDEGLPIKKAVFLLAIGKLVELG